MNHDKVRALLLSVACFEIQFDRPPTRCEIEEMRGPDLYPLLRMLADQRLIVPTQLSRVASGGVGWSALQAQGVRTY